MKFLKTKYIIFAILLTVIFSFFPLSLIRLYSPRIVLKSSDYPSGYTEGACAQMVIIDEVGFPIAVYQKNINSSCDWEAFINPIAPFLNFIVFLTIINGAVWIKNRKS